MRFKREIYPFTPKVGRMQSVNSSLVANRMRSLFAWKGSGMLFEVCSRGIEDGMALPQTSSDFQMEWLRPQDFLMSNRKGVCRHRSALVNSIEKREFSEIVTYLYKFEAVRQVSLKIQETFFYRKFFILKYPIRVCVGKWHCDLKIEFRSIETADVTSISRLPISQSIFINSNQIYQVSSSTRALMQTRFSYSRNEKYRINNVFTSF